VGKLVQTGKRFSLQAHPDEFRRQSYPEEP
jgi:hypothetical protein